MAHRFGSGRLSACQSANTVALGTARQSERLCTLRHNTESVALPLPGLRRGLAGIVRATIRNAIRAPCGKDGAMKRAARFKTGSVVFDKRRKTWNFLRWENGKRRSKLIGTLSQYP